MSSSIQKNKLTILGKLAASLAHEIRNPLSALKLNLEYIQLSKDEISDDIQKSILECKEAADRIQILIENTLEFSRRSSGKGIFSINEIVEKALRLIASSVQKYNINIKTSFSLKIPPLVLNKNKILQVILNLLTNAVEASKKNSFIEVKTYLGNAEYVILEIKDYGVGITEDEKDKIFSDFYTNKKGGTGLGLGVCKMLLLQNDAEIYFKSKLNYGTSFFIKFKVDKDKVFDETKNINY